MERVGYILLALVVAIWFVAIVAGMIAAFPFGLIGLLAIAGIGLLLIRAFRDRLASKEDDYYSKNVQQ
jgi:hypothetical protein